MRLLAKSVLFVSAVLLSAVLVFFVVFAPQVPRENLVETSSSATARVYTRDYRVDLSGTVLMVDPDKRSFRLKHPTGNESVVVSVSPSRQDMVILLTKISVGSKVKVSAVAEADKIIAQTVKVIR